MDDSLAALFMHAVLLTHAALSQLYLYKLGLGLASLVQPQ